MEILQRYANLFWVIWACLVTLTQNDSIILQKTWMFICMEKIKFIIHLFLTILHFKESCDLIGWQHFGPKLELQNFARCVGEISITILVFILEYFQEKPTWQNFLKNPKSYFGSFLGFFCLNLGKNKFPWKKKTQLCLMSHSWENFRVLRLIAKSHNLMGEEHFGPYLKNQSFPKYEICSSIQQLQ